MLGSTGTVDCLERLVSATNRCVLGGILTRSHVASGEAVNVSSGLGYNGVDENGRPRWNLVDNADILQIEVLAVFVVFDKILVF